MSHDDRDAMLDKNAEQMLKAMRQAGIAPGEDPRSPYERIQSLRERAAQLTEEKQNELTVGREGEIYEDQDQGPFSIRQLPLDKDGVLRISIGASPELPGSEYLSFRGDPEAIKGLLVDALDAFCELTREKE